MLGPLRDSTCLVKYLRELVRAAVPAPNAPNADADLSPITVCQGTVSFTPQFKYLGSLVHYSLSDLNEVQARISAAANAFGASKKFLCDRRLALKDRIRMFSVHVVGVLTVGAAHLALTSHLLHLLGVFYRSSLRRILGISHVFVWKEGMTNAALLGLAGLPDLEETFVRLRLGWIGKVTRKSVTSLPRLFLSSWVAHSRPIGRPQTTTPSSHLHDCTCANLDIIPGELISSLFTSVL
jgi:hypothetical protein